MIIDEYKAIFIHERKTGGTSIQKCFNGYKLKKHAFASEIKEACPNEFATYYKFAFVRNPYDWIVSFYHYVAMMGYIPPWSFDKFIHNLDNGELFKHRPSCERSMVPQLRMLQIDGKIAVDFVGRFENLQKDFDRICERIGRPKTVLPHLQRTNHQPYQKYYTKETKDIVTRLYKEDLEAFNYG